MRPRLVLVHGTRMNAGQWEPYRALLPGIEVITFDLPGHGSRAGEEFTATSALAAIEEAVRAAGERPVLAGHSLGGYLAMMWAHQHPEALSTLVLLGATADPRGPLTGVYRGFARLLPRVGPERMARVANGVVRALGARGEQAAALPDGAGYAALPAAWELVMQQVRPDLLSTVRCRVVLANGQYDQMRVHVRRFAEQCADVRVLTVPRASHLMPLTHPEAVATILRDAVLAVPTTGPGRDAPPD